jgi:hypothetical protein
LWNRDQAAVRVKSANIPPLISNNEQLAADMRPLVFIAPRPHCVDPVSTFISHLCKRAHLVMISAALKWVNLFFIYEDYYMLYACGVGA